MNAYENVWNFNTAKFTVSLDVAPEEMDPVGNCSATGDDELDAECVEFCREGGWHWFVARVQVKVRDDANPRNWTVVREDVLGEDYLGACSYHSLADFKADGYFRDMVGVAIAEARQHLARLAALNVRAA
jgi:hypothetical protein